MCVFLSKNIYMYVCLYVYLTELRRKMTFLVLNGGYLSLAVLTWALVVLRARILPLSCRWILINFLMVFDGSAPVPLKRRRFTNFDSMEVEEAKVGLFENLPSPQHIKSSRFLVLGRSGFSLLQSICCLNSTGYCFVRLVGVVPHLFLLFRI